jgi:uncharacterized cupredoxin-like copper-binding protein/plastocyanin
VSRRIVSALAVALATATWTACWSGEDDPAPDTSTSQQPDRRAARLSVDALEPAPGRYSFGRVPQSVPGGLVRIELRNLGTEGHEFALVKLDPGHTPDEYRRDIEAGPAAAIPAYAHPAGGAGGVGPGQSAETAVVLGEGQYAFACFIPGHDDVAHHRNGMFGSLVVRGEDPAAQLPRTDALVAATEYGFAVPALVAGTTTITFANIGKEVHDAFLVAIAPGRSFEEVKAYFGAEGPQAGSAPVDLDRSTGTTSQGIEAGGRYVTDVVLERGDYALVCFVADRAGGPPHYAKGMLRRVVVT